MKMVPKRSRIMGITMVEVLISTTILSLVFGLLIYATLGLQRSFAGSEHYFSSQGDQMRLLDYVGTDVRRSLAAAAGTNAVVFNGTSYSNALPQGATAVLTALLPNYWNEGVNPVRRRTPTVEKGKVAYGNAPVRVTYFTQSGNLYRMEVDPDLPSTSPRNTPRTIAYGVGDFAVNITLPTGDGSLASSGVTFAPRFSRQNWAASLSTTSSTASRNATVVGGTIQLRNKGRHMTLSASAN
jgi:hypothetical protein